MTAGAGRVRTERPKRPPATMKWIFSGVFAAIVLWSALTIEIEADRLLDLPAGLSNMFYLFFLRNGPDWTALGGALDAMLESVQIAWLGTIIGAILSLPMGFLGAKNVTSGLVSNVVRLVLNAIRAIPEILVAVVVFIPMVGLGPYAGTLAIGVHSIGTLGKLSAEVVEGIDPGPVEAARATGGRTFQVQRWGVLPQVLPEIVAFWLYRFEINVRASAILGAVGAGGVGEFLVQAINFRRYDRAGMAIIVVIVITILIDLASGWVRRRIIEGGPGGPVDPELQVALEDRATASMFIAGAAGADGGAEGDDSS
ncbi:MAG: phosphonate ABC transporter, permease protein PhnE [Candidatus Limnocylindria bacterium]